MMALDFVYQMHCQTPSADYGYLIHLCYLYGASYPNWERALKLQYKLKVETPTENMVQEKRTIQKIKDKNKNVKLTKYNNNFQITVTIIHTLANWQSR